MFNILKLILESRDQLFPDMARSKLHGKSNIPKELYLSRHYLVLGFLAFGGLAPSTSFESFTRFAGFLSLLLSFLSFLSLATDSVGFLMFLGKLVVKGQTNIFRTQTCNFTYIYIYSSMSFNCRVWAKLVQESYCG